MTIQDAAQTLVIERFENSPELWADGYNFEVEYDQVDIFLENESQLTIVFYEDHATVRGRTAGSARFEYADPAFDDKLVDELRRRLHV